MGNFLQLGGSVLQSKAQLEQGKAAASAANFNAEMARIQGIQKESLIRRTSRRQIGRMRTAIAKSGVRIEGSPLEALADSAAEAEMDALNARFESGATQKLQRMQGKAALKSAKIGAGATLLTGVSNFASSFSMPGGGG